MNKYTAATHTNGTLSVLGELLHPRLIIKALLALALCWALLGCVDAPQAPKTIINNVNIVDPVDGLITQQQVVIQDDIIVYVGPAEKINAASEAGTSDQVVDAMGQFLIPGLWDMHVHFLYDEALTDVMPELFLLDLY
jgi:hypothetical protein